MVEFPLLKPKDQKRKKNRKGIYDEKLLETYREVPCELCSGNWLVAGHHKVFKSKLRIDLPENLISLCKKCHDDLHFFHRSFIKRYGEDLFNELYNPRDLIQNFRERGIYSC